MIIDSSAIVAIVFQEPGYERVATVLASAPEKGIATPTLIECGILLSSCLDLDSRGLLNRFVREANIAIVPFTEAHFDTAIGAWLRYGKGRHPAALNFGNCISYSAARVSGLPLLCVGNDFPKTDLVLA